MSFQFFVALSVLTLSGERHCVIL